MKQFSKSWLMALAIALVAGITIPVLTLGKSGRTLGAEHLPVSNARIIDGKKKAKRMATAQMPENANPYWAYAISAYDDDQQFSFYDGKDYNYGIYVARDGEKVTFSGLANLYYAEIDRTYDIEGTYNDRTGIITVTGTEYSSSKPVKDFIKVADAYLPDRDVNVGLYLFAGTLEHDGNISTEDELTFKVAANWSKITAQKAIAIYGIKDDGTVVGCYDMYMSLTMSVPEKEVELGASVPELTFPTSFVTNSATAYQTFTVYNSGSQTTSVSFSTSDDELKIIDAPTELMGCSTGEVTVALTASEVGMYNGTVTITNGDDTLDVPVNVMVYEEPDYTRIVKNGSAPIEFKASVPFPFVIEERYGHTVAGSTNNGHDRAESWLACTVEVPAGQVGLFSWKAMMECQQPNSLVIFLDGEMYKYELYRPNTDPYDMSDAISLTSGKHEIAFSNDITMDQTMWDITAYSYIWDLDFRLYEAKGDNVTTLDNEVTFDKTYFDKLSVQQTYTIKLFNIGTNVLRVNSVTPSGNFSAIVPDISVPNGGNIEMTLTWDASKVGTDTGDVTIHTTAGDVVVKCSGEALALPYDYQKIVTSGELSFNTNMEWPFVINDSPCYLYNSTSLADTNGVTDSWLEVSFVVPENEVGLINWEAINDSDEPFVFMDIPSILSGTMISIDGGEEIMIAGENKQADSQVVCEPQQTVFRAGRHSIRFTYHKISDEEEYVKGDDRLKLFAIGLETVSEGDMKGVLSEKSVEWTNPVFMGTEGHAYLTLYNYTVQTPVIESMDCDGPFSIVNRELKDGNLNLMAVFAPKTEGTFVGSVTLHTNIGDYTLNCSGTSELSDLGEAIFYDSFEYGISKDWILTDASEGNDYANLWGLPSSWELGYFNGKPTVYDGNGSLVATYCTQDGHYTNSVDTYALTPEIEIPADGKTTLRFMMGGDCFMDQNLEVLVGEGKNVKSFTLVDTFVDGPNSPEWSAKTLDLSKWAGKKIRIAFRADDSVSTFIGIDDILVASTAKSKVSQIATGNNVVEWYTVQGLRISAPQKGLNIKRTRFEDGRVETVKVMCK